MVTLNMWTLLVACGVPTAITGFCFWYIKKYIDKREKRQDELRKAQLRNQVLIIQSTQASIALGEAVAIAMKHGKCNGETERALEYAKRIKEEQNSFLHEQGIINILKED